VNTCSVSAADAPVENPNSEKPDIATAAARIVSFNIAQFLIVAVDYSKLAT
jgi:hypothetical protein